MAQALRKPAPGIAAAHIAGFTTVSAAPELHVSTFTERAGEARAQVFYPQWWRNPAIVMRGWRPRAIAARQSLSERVATAVTALVDQVREWRERARSRQALLKLDEHMLRDLGIDRASARYMGSLPFWRADD
jgi:uncharacterized protein YjiS (DUF1127 family)